MTTVDSERLKQLLAEAQWHERPDYGRGVEHAYHGVGGPIAEALGWECSFCRPDVGWADWTRAEKRPDGTIYLYVECGYCGAQFVFDAEGNEIEEGDGG